MEMPHVAHKIRIFLLGSQSIFGNGIENLLSREQFIEIVGFEETSDQAVDHIRELAPDVVILVGSGSPEIVLRILQGGVGIKIIMLNLEKNSICIYQGEQRVVQGIQDLMLAIQ